MVEDPLSQQREYACVARDHLPQPVHSSAWSAKKELLDHLRSKRRMRRSRHSSEHGQSRGKIVDAISIRERPAEAEDRAIPGHWEGDLLSGGKNSYIATLVERHSRFLMLIKVPSKETKVVVAALSQRVRKLPATLKRSLRGTADWRWRSTRTSRWRRMCRSTSAIRKVPGSVGRTKIRICCCGNIFREELTCLPSLKRGSTRSRCA